MMCCDLPMCEVVSARLDCIGCCFAADGVREIEVNLFPPGNTVFDYYIDHTGKECKPWSDKLSGTWRPPKIQFAKIIVPTVDTLRNGFMLEYAIKHRLHMLIVGNTGTGTCCG